MAESSVQITSCLKEILVDNCNNSFQKQYRRMYLLSLRLLRLKRYLNVRFRKISEIDKVENEAITKLVFDNNKFILRISFYKHKEPCSLKLANKALCVFRRIYIDFFTSVCYNICI